MREEVNPLILEWFIKENLRQRRPNLTELLERLGIEVSSERETLRAWSWRRANSFSPRHIITIWSEDIVIGEDGRWEVEAWLEPSDDPHFNEDQRRRERERISLLREMYEHGIPCKAILMIDRYSREDHRVKGIAATAELRVLDADESWYLEDRGTSSPKVLKRGLLREHKNASDREEKSETGAEEPALHFPDPETRKRVETAAIEHAKVVYAPEGDVVSVEADKCGYDLKVIDPVTGETKLKVEVKGTSSDVEQFYLTRNEHREARSDPGRWRLAVVVDALNMPSLQEYQFKDIDKKFTMEPLVWHCSPKGRG